MLPFVRDNIRAGGVELKNNNIIKFSYSSDLDLRQKCLFNNCCDLFEKGFVRSKM